MTTRVRSILSLALLALLLSPSARADVMTYCGEGLCDDVQIRSPGHMADGLTTLAGQMMLSYKGAEYAGWCVDIDQYAGTSSVTEESYTVLANHNALAYLMDTYADSLASDLDAAALAACIWEVVNEPEGGAFNINGGHFSIRNNSAVTSRAAAWLASIPAGYSSQTNYIILHSTTAQDMLIEGPGIGGAHVDTPEPGTLVLLIAGGVMALARRGARRT
jgi:hypothetical protein